MRHVREGTKAGRVDNEAEPSGILSYGSAHLTDSADAVMNSMQYSEDGKRNIVPKHDAAPATCMWDFWMKI